MSAKISRKQSEVLEYIKQQILKKGYPPSVREICEAVDLKSTSSVHAHLASLEKKGYIRRDPSKPRAIEILDDEYGLTRRDVVNVPMVGLVTAGEPILAVENISGYFPMPADMLPDAEVFMLKVRGESMIDAGILSGDYVLVKQQETAENSDVVCALIDDSATIKSFYKEDGYFRLQPENQSMEPIITKECSILGKVIGLVRMGM
ncbi:MAG: transcriptional repressor LexA [Lachnospiraceae bacterium]|nr:transcriptional repressor LexA [Lachnospiraceae bacterium]